MKTETTYIIIKTADSSGISFKAYAKDPFTRKNSTEFKTIEEAQNWIDKQEPI